MKVLVPLADGVEEMEAVIVVDTLRRARWDVVTAGLKPGVVTASRGVKLVPDAVLGEVDLGSFDMLFIPGGSKGVDNLRADPRVLEAVRQFSRKPKHLAAICAGPLVLQEAGVLTGRKVTCHPGEAAKITQAQRLQDRVVVDGNLVTSQGAGTTFDLALKLIELFDGRDKAASVAKGMVFDWHP